MTGEPKQSPQLSSDEWITTDGGLQRIKLDARVVAANHDTSTAIIEKTYSRFIADHADTIARRGLLDTETPAVANVVPIARQG
jgi:hypothetical protein